MKLTDEQINRAVAEECGWIIHMEGDKCSHWISPNHGKLRFDSVPNYANDLNACAEMEQSLSRTEAVRYRILLAANSDGPDASFPTMEAAMCHAKARQRCEAFLKVKGKWVDAA